MLENPNRYSLTQTTEIILQNYCPCFPARPGVLHAGLLKTRHTKKKHFCVWMHEGWVNKKNKRHLFSTVALPVSIVLKVMSCERIQPIQRQDRRCMKNIKSEYKFFSWNPNPSTKSHLSSPSINCIISDKMVSEEYVTHVAPQAPLFL